MVDKFRLIDNQGKLQEAIEKTQEFIEEKKEKTQNTEEVTVNSEEIKDVIQNLSTLKSYLGQSLEKIEQKENINNSSLSNLDTMEMLMINSSMKEIDNVLAILSEAIAQNPKFGMFNLKITAIEVLTKIMEVVSKFRLEKEKIEIEKEKLKILKWEKGFIDETEEGVEGSSGLGKIIRNETGTSFVEELNEELDKIKDIKDLKLL